MSGRLSAYRSVLGGGARLYAPWVVALRGASGVYVIKSGSEVVYIGESHTDRLYETLTRHFQQWHVGKWWLTQGRKGVTYAADVVTVAVVVTSAGRAIELQNRLIKLHQPRDNEVGK